MSAHSPLSVDRSERGITLLTLNRPEKRNALNLELIELLDGAIAESEALPGQRVLLLAGAGPVFCAGMDLAESRLPEKIDLLARGIGSLLLRLYSSPLVTIAAVRGAALAGGSGIVSACDFAVAAEGTKIGYPEVVRGLVPAQVATLLRRRLTEGAMRRLLLLGETIDAEEARTLGLVTTVAFSEELLPEAKRLAARACGGAPGAIAETKRLIALLAARDLGDDLATAEQFLRRAARSSEAEEGIRAFLEKRPPSWSRADAPPDPPGN